jgi:hypothetical protein
VEIHITGKTETALLGCPPLPRAKDFPESEFPLTVVWENGGGNTLLLDTEAIPRCIGYAFDLLFDANACTLCTKTINPCLPDAAKAGKKGFKELKTKNKLPK